MTESTADTGAPHPGSRSMPQWNVADLHDAPRFGMKNWAMMLGPGLVLGGAAIGGGEWLTGPMVTAKYGGALLWLATLSILGQVIYNLEISRYTLYSGEPIFTGKFRTLPGPRFWVMVYLVLDFGSIFPYLAAFAATPLATSILGEVPRPKDPSAMAEILGMTLSHEVLLRYLAYAIFLGALVPLVFGGKIFNALKAIMSFKIVTLMTFLLILGVFYSTPETWKEIFSGFFKFGNVPVERVDDINENGRIDEGEDWDGDGHADVIEPSTKLKFGRLDFGSLVRFDFENFKVAPYATDLDRDGKPDPMVQKDGKPWPDLDQDGKPDETFKFDVNGDGEIAGLHEGPFKLDANEDGKLDDFVDIDGDLKRDGDNIDNIFVSVLAGRGLPDINWALIGVLSALVAISGSGGLSNTPISNYTRDQGWGMGHHVGAIPSVIGGQNLQLSHVGTVFKPTAESLPKWKRWYRHIVRDQLVVWLPACFFGLALPSMLSVQFLERGFEVPDKWVAATMTAEGVAGSTGDSEQESELKMTRRKIRELARVPGDHSQEIADYSAREKELVAERSFVPRAFWFTTIFCGFLVLAPSMATSADGIIRRWVDVFWTSSKTLRAVDPKNIRFVYFGVLAVYAVFGMTMLSLEEPQTLLVIATTIFNFALGFSCWHTLAVNTILLPKELRPGWFMRTGLFATGAFFWMIAIFSTMEKFGVI